MQPHTRPLRSTQDNKGYAPASKVLLVTHILVACQKNIETAALGHGQQITIGERIPSPVFGLRHNVANEKPSNAARRYMVKQNEHLRQHVQRER